MCYVYFLDYIVRVIKTWHYPSIVRVSPNPGAHPVFACCDCRRDLSPHGLGVHTAQPAICSPATQPAATLFVCLNKHSDGVDMFDGPLSR